MTYQYKVKTGTEVTAGGDSFRQVVYPNGYEITVIYNSLGIKQSVLTNTGLQLKYINNHVNDAPSNAKAAPSVSKIIAINNAVEYCSPTAASCSLVETWPTVTYDWPKYSDIHWTSGYPIESGSVTGYFKVTDPIGRVTVYSYTPQATAFLNGIYYSPRISAVKEWDAAGTTGSATFTPARTTYKYDDYKHCYINNYGTLQCDILKYGVVSEVRKGEAKWTYNYDQPATQYVTLGKSIGPKGTHDATMNYDGDVNLAATGVSSFLTQVRTPDDITVAYNKGKLGWPTSAMVKGKGYIYKYDDRGNIVKEIQTPASSSKITTAIYEPCTSDNFRWCNKAAALIDAKSNQTDYIYSNDHGQVTSVTLPPDQNGIRAQTRYKYTKLFASYKDASNVVKKATTGVWMLTEENSCSEGAADDEGEGCVIPSKLVTTKYYYGSDSAPNNLWLRGIEKIADGKILRTCYQYDIYGNTIAETAPKADLASCP